MIKFVLSGESEEIARQIAKELEMNAYDFMTLFIGSVLYSLRNRDIDQEMMDALKHIKHLEGYMDKKVN